MGHEVTHFMDYRWSWNVIMGHGVARWVYYWVIECFDGFCWVIEGYRGSCKIEVCHSGSWKAMVGILLGHQML